MYNKSYKLNIFQRGTKRTESRPNTTMLSITQVAIVREKQPGWSGSELATSHKYTLWVRQRSSFTRHQRKYLSLNSIAVKVVWRSDHVWNHTVIPLRFLYYRLLLMKSFTKHPQENNKRTRPPSRIFHYFTRPCHPNY